MPIQRVKLRTAVNLFLAEGLPRAKPATIRGYGASLEALLRVTGSQLSAHMLRPAHFDAAIKDLKAGASEEENARRARVGYNKRSGRSATTINNDITAFRSFVKYLWRNNLLDRGQNPVEHLELVTWSPSHPVQQLVVDPTEENYALLLAAAGERHPRARAAVALGLYAGLRVSELQELRVGNIDFAAGEIRVWRRKVKAKEGAWHEIPMFPELADELRTYLAWLTATVGPLDAEWYVLGARPVPQSKLTENGFNPNAGRVTPRTPVDPTRPASNIALDIKAVVKAAGFTDLKRVGAHTLRRTAGIMVTELTGDRRNAQALYGHETEGTTEHYLQYNDKKRKLKDSIMKFSRQPNPEPPVAVLPPNVIQLRRKAAAA